MKQRERERERERGRERERNRERQTDRQSDSDRETEVRFYELRLFKTERAHKKAEEHLGRSSGIHEIILVGNDGKVGGSISVCVYGQKFLIKSQSIPFLTNSV